MKTRAILTSLVLALSLAATQAQPAPTYDALIQQGKAQLQAGNPAQALASGQQAIQLDATRWEAYALAGGALMNLKRYEEAADNLSLAIQHASEAKQDGLRALRKQCVLAETGATPAPAQPAPPPQPATTTQAEIVLWKSIENSTNAADFQSYLNAYPNGAFVVLANRHLSEIEKQAQQAAKVKAVQEQMERNSPSALLQKGESEIASKDQRAAGIHDLRALIQQYPKSHEATVARSKLNGLGVRVTGK